VIVKHLNTLELPKILDRLAKHCSFAASEALAHDLRPSHTVSETARRLSETTQAREALEKLDSLSIGGARDVRESVQRAAHAGVLEPRQLLDIRDTLNAGRSLQRTLSRYASLYPQLTAMTNLIEPCGELALEIARCIDDSGEVRDSASPELAAIRREVRIVHDRLLQKLNRLVANSDVAQYLQEAIVTQRGGRYVIPIKADFKGRVPGLIHDQSSSGMTLFIEPLATLDDNNRWRELQLAEEREVWRVLVAASSSVGAEADAITRTVEAIARFDLALAKAKYAHATRCVAPTVMANKREERRLELVQARHPLLDPATVVPIDIAFDERTRIVVITGPNTGGKTVALKTIGLLAAMAQCGLHVPCEQASLPVFDRIYADIGDEQSIEQSLSTYSSHLTNLVSFLDQVDSESLVLLDELGAGTDPTEGAAIARAMLEFLLLTNALCVVATHYPDLKAWASLTDGAQNANMAFDYETLRPLFRLSMGLPGRSNAFAIAQRLGIPESILAKARGYMDGNAARAEDMLAEIARLQEESERERAAARRSQVDAEAAAERIRVRLNSIEDERRVLLQEAREAAAREVENLRAEVRKLRARVVAAGGALDEVKAIESAVEVVRDMQETVVAPPPPPIPEPQRKRPVQPGDAVRVRSLNSEAVVSAVMGGEADVQIGRMRMRVRLADLERVRVKKREEEPQADEKPVVQERAPSPGMELDIRGRLVEEGLELLEEYLDRAQRAGLPFVRIIHGKGTGVLRRAVREAVKRNAATASFESGREGEGGDGVTVVKLQQ
jgi:DNA mismatch repair protein MutS2